MAENKVYTALGFMSGTSLDGIDAALIETDGRTAVRPLGFLTVPYAERDRAVVRAAFGKTERGDTAVAEAEEIVTARHAEAGRQLLEQTGITPDIAGFHGQTVYHNPGEGVTVQIGDAGALARALGVPVVADFRSADVQAGGEGAPLAPLYHWARCRQDGLALPAAILNIGGVANVTYVTEAPEALVAFDTGPGNALLDDWTLRRTGAAFDEGGTLAASGRADAEILRGWLAHAYFRRQPPKSLDRDQWDIAAMGPLARALEGMGDADGAATLLGFTAEGVLAALDHLPEAPRHWYACGGGRHNTALMAALGQRLAEKGGEIAPVESLGWDGDATEAECFAYLAVRHAKRLPLSLPGTTGVKAPQTGGVLFTP